MVMDFQKESPESHRFEDLEYVVQFYYPDFGTLVFEIDIRADPGPSWRPNAKAQVPFSQDTSNVLFVVSLRINAEECLIQFLPSNGLTSLLENEVTRYDWEEWGPDRSRFLILPQSYSEFWGCCTMHGWKYVKLEPNTSQDGSLVHLYDFNQLAINRNYRDSVGKGTCAIADRWQYKRGRTVLVPETIFEDLVETSFPYRSQVLPMRDTHNHCHGLCSEDHIIVVDVSFREKCSEDC